MNSHLQDIENKADIKIFVDAFYEQAKSDQTIGAVFLARIKAEEWQIHMDRMYSFWNTVLFSKQDYIGNPFAKHRDLPIYKDHFDAWLILLGTTLDKHFKGPKTEEVKERAEKMGQMFQAKLQHFRSGDTKYPMV